MVGGGRVEIAINSKWLKWRPSPEAWDCFRTGTDPGSVWVSGPCTEETRWCLSAPRSALKSSRPALFSQSWKTPASRPEIQLSCAKVRAEDWVLSVWLLLGAVSQCYQLQHFTPGSPLYVHWIFTDLQCNSQGELSPHTSLTKRGTNCTALTQILLISTREAERERRRETGFYQNKTIRSVI